MSERRIKVLLVEDNPGRSAADQGIALGDEIK
jgi:hypothetical protein